MDYEKLKLKLAEEVGEFMTRYQHDKDAQPRGLMLESIINSFKDYNYNFEQTLENVAGILNNNWVFKMTINGLFRPIDKTTDIQLKVDGKVKVKGHKTWPSFMFEATQKVGIEMVSQLFPEVVNKDKSKVEIFSKGKNLGQKKTNKIVLIDGFYINQQSLAGGSQNSYPKFVNAVNKHFKYEKIEVNHITKIYSAELEKYYKL